METSRRYPLTVPMLIRAELLRRECGISYRALARLLAIDYERPVNEHTLRHNLRQRGVPKLKGRITDPERKNLEAA